ncbi:claudin-8 [Microcaecilia unicolor]|uniref:Claudin n=1 Tax=Microcaecilia unicolor TaxID=1415580 RepID=A0A6P7Y036_9AMPH|nr:claudin-8-like [Microcaecilia unicolor]
MASGISQIIGMVLGGIGLVGTCAVTGMPQWRVTAFIDNNIVVFEAFWEGLWMNCVRQANIRMQCKVYDSLLALTQDLQASRALMCVAVTLSFIAFMVAFIGLKCTRCSEDNEQAKGFMLLSSGIIFIMSGITVLIPVSWTAHNIIRNFYNPVVNVAQKRELGDALYIGWATSLCLVAAGIILCCSFHRNDTTYKYSLPPQAPSYNLHQGLGRKSSSLYSKSQYV